MTPHIPKKGAKQVIYYGAYSQAWRGRERRQGISTTATAEEKLSSLFPGKGPDGFLQKPFSPDSLKSKLNDIFACN